MDSLTQIKTQNLLEFVQKTLGSNGKEDRQGTWFNSSNEDKTASLLVYHDNNKGYCDFSNRLGAGTIIDFYMNFHNCDNKIAIKNLKEIFKIEEEKKEFKKSPTNEEILNNFKSFQLEGKPNLIFNKFLKTRGVDLEKNKEKINEISKEFGVCENKFLPKLKLNKEVILFPEYNENKEVIGVKYRRADGELIDGIKKELGITGSKNGVIFDKIDEEEMIICEGPPDYIILKILGYDNVICNAGGVQNCREVLKKLLYKTKNIICAYDNDQAGISGAIALQEQMKRPLRIVKYPESGKDINDLYKQGYTKKDFDEMFLGCEIEEEKKEFFKIKEQKDGYYFEKKVKDNTFFVKISDFLVEIIDLLEEKTSFGIERSLILKIKHQSGEMIETFSYKDCCDCFSFKKKIRKINPFCNLFDFKNEHLDELLRYLTKNKKAIYTIIIDKKGYIPEYNCWIFQEGVIFNQKFFEFDENRIANIGQIKIKLQLENNYFLPKYYESHEDISQKIIPHFNHMFGGINGDLVLGFLIASLFVNSMHFTAFPILFVFGKKGSGKTTAIEHAIKILGIQNSKNIAESDSVFVDQQNSNIISSLPYWSDEYKNGKKSMEKETFYKTLFDRSGVSKGTVTEKGLGINIMNVFSTLILSGEQTPNDDAVFSRVCLIDVDGIRQGDLFDEIQEESENYPYIIKKLLIDNNFKELEKDFKIILDKVKTILKKNGIKNRLLDVYSPILAGFSLYKKIFLKEGISQEYLNEIIKKIETKKEKEKEDILDDFFTKVFFLFENKYIIGNYNEHIRYNNGLMNINFTYLYSLYSQYEKDNKISKKDLKDYLEKGYGAKRSSMIKDLGFDENGQLRHNTLSFTIKKNNYPKIFDDYFNFNF